MKHKPLLAGIAGLLAFVFATALAPGGGLAGLGPDWLTSSSSKITPRVASPAAYSDQRASSAVEVRSAATGLKIKVSQTTNLVNQTIDVSWTGGKPTEGTPNFGADFLQIMQCWGDTSPTREQCQFGAETAFDTRGGINAASRQLNQSLYADPDEPLTKDLPAQQDAFVPFRPVKGDPVTGSDTLKNPYYDQSTTNEIPFAATRGDGTGFETFETQTYREAPGLGCGDLLANGKPRACWLVVVPRGETEVDGSTWDKVAAQGSHRLDSSPLSTTNWAKRVVIPLKFAAVGQVCPIEAAQRPLGGAEQAAEAVLRWQPALCANKGPVFSYTQTADAVSERKLMGDAPAMSFLSSAVAQVPGDRRLVYAPLTVSGISIAVMMERQTPAEAPPADKARDGERLNDVRLNARLVAKLLTQSYVLDVGPNARYLKANPDNITKDPEFLKLNPVFKDLSFRDSVETLAPIGIGDAEAVLWRWIAADQDARDFVGGLPDPWGMRVNPFYQGTDVPRDSFPKIDPFCDATVAPDGPPLCTLDRHPYAQDFHDAARSAARGDQLSRTNWDVNGNPPAWKKNPLQLNGQRHILAVTDSATAARFGLVTAKLENAAGQFVAPDAKGLTAGLAKMQSISGALQADPESTARAAYPLTTVTYAVTAPNKLSKAEAKDYASFIRYAAGRGQSAGNGLGNLPLGYLPLTATLKRQALATATDVQNRVGPPATSGGGGGPGGPGGSGSGSGDSGDGGNPAGSGGGGSAGPAPSATPTPSPTTTLPTTAIKQLTPTPGIGAVASRYAVLIALTLGICALVAGLLLPRLARRLGR